MITSSGDRKCPWFVCLLVAALPFLEMNALVRVAFDRPLSYFSPSLNDEVGYWHQSATFARAGFSGGYYTFEEHAAPSRLVHFGVHGPVYPILYGSIARATGWYVNSAPAINAALVGLAIIGFAVLTNASTVQVLLLGAVVVTFWPIAFFLPSNMQEPLHYAFAIVAGGLVGRALGDDAALPPWVRWTGWIALAVMILARLSWSIALVMWALAPGGTVTKVVRRLVLAGALTVALVAAFFKIAAPIPNSSIVASSFTAAAGFRPVVNRVTENLARLGKTGEFEAIEIWHRGVYAGALVIAVAGVIVAVRRRSAAATRHAFAHLVNVGGIVSAMYVLYAISNQSEIRIIAAHILLSAAVLVAYGSRPARKIIVCLVVAGVAAAPIFWEDFHQNRDANFRRDLRSQRLLEEMIEKRVAYRPGALPWCNTLLTAQYPPDLVAVPAGIGLSTLLDPERLSRPIKSGYVLLDNRTSELASTLTLEPIGELPYGTLYVNRSAPCR